MFVFVRRICVGCLVLAFSSCISNCDISGIHEYFSSPADASFNKQQDSSNGILLLKDALVR